MILNIDTELKDKITGVIHVGAHEGQEIEFYQNMNCDKVDWHEANYDVYKRLCENIKNLESHRAFNHAVSDEDGEIEFNISNNDGSSSSILPLKLHKRYYPHIKYEKTVKVKSVCLNTFYKDTLMDYNTIMMDVQGAEFKVLSGATNLLTECIKYIYTEVNFEELYEGAKTVNDVDEFLNRYGFKRTHTADSRFGWGDALYQK